MAKRVKTQEGTYVVVDDDIVEKLRGLKISRSSYPGYYRIWKDGKSQMLHRWIMGVTDPSKKVDHKFGNKLDCRRKQLRVCTNQQNVSNQRKRPSESGFKGLFRKGPFWAARIKVNYKAIHLGRFKDKDVAARVYDKAAVKYFGEFARLNFPIDKDTALEYEAPKESLPGILYSRNTSGYRGVSRFRDGFRVALRVNYKLIHGGDFKTAIEAAEFYDRLAKQWLGSKAKLNFPWL